MAAPNKKNNTTTQKHRYLGEARVRPVLYNGRALGFGKYFAGEVNGQLVMDGDRPMAYNSIGELK